MSSQLPGQTSRTPLRVNFRTPNAPKEAAADERSCLDRAGALLEGFRQSRASRAQQYLSLADTVLGPILRDAEYLRDRVAELGNSDRSLRPPFLVVLGLVGEPNEVVAAAVDSRNTPNARAFVLASALAILDPSRLAIHLMRPCAHSVARRVL